MSQSGFELPGEELFEKVSVAIDSDLSGNAPEKETSSREEACRSPHFRTVHNSDRAAKTWSPNYPG
jgi:hypothetical protein